MQRAITNHTKTRSKEMIRASEKFKEKLRRTLQATRGVLELPELSPLQRHYYGDIWELLQRLQGMLYVLDEAEEINLKTDAEIKAEIEEEEEVEKVRQTIRGIGAKK
jgi:hypothetical protein